MEVCIDGRILGRGYPAFVVAEISASHGGKLERALELVRAAKRAGADAIKLQTYTADTITFKSHKRDFVIPAISPWSEYKTMWDLYDVAKTPWEWHAEIFSEAKKNGLVAFSSPFDNSAVDFLESQNVPAYKIASPEITDIPLLERVAATGKPIIISTGLATLEDLELAIGVLKGGGAHEIVMLKCNSSYPSPPSDSNLKTISDMPERFGVLSGLSDHTLGIADAIVSIALGACVIEKHIKLNGDESSVDAFFSASESTFTEMVKSIREVELSIGIVDYQISESAKKNLMGRKSLYAVQNIAKGALITSSNIKSIRPAYGIHPKFYSDLIGRRVAKDVESGDRLSWDMFE
jgi:pseudaminic acid synthase